jgi:hypothetical protein
MVKKEQELPGYGLKRKWFLQMEKPPVPGSKQGTGFPEM